MGRTAGGVQGMSLKEEDQIVWGSLEMGYKTLELETNRGGKSEVKVTSIKNQNRAGKGSNIMKMVLDETISKVTPK